MLSTRASEAGLRQCTARCTTVAVSPRERVGCVASLHEIGSPARFFHQEVMPMGARNTDRSDVSEQVRAAFRSLS